MKTIRLIIKGKVQGVFFRVTAKQIADELKITGQVKNNPNQSVEIIASGKEPDLQKFIAWAKIGSPSSIVESVHIEELPVELFPSFRITK